MISAFALIPMLYSRGTEEGPSEIPQYKNRVFALQFSIHAYTDSDVPSESVPIYRNVLSKLIAPFIKLMDGLLKFSTNRILGF